MLPSFPLLIPRPPSSSLFPYTTLFRSSNGAGDADRQRRCGRLRGDGGRDVDGAADCAGAGRRRAIRPDRKSTRLNSSHLVISYAVFCLKKKSKYFISYCCINNIIESIH